MNYYYRSIPSAEMSDNEPFYTQMAHELPDNAYIAELGVAEGRGVILLASLMAVAGKKCTIWAVDNFSYGKDDQRRILQQNIDNCNETSIQVMDMSSLEAACRCQDGQFNLVYIDSSHLYENTRAEIMLWFHKVVMGGILAGHDYQKLPEVKQAVDELIPADHLHVQDTEYQNGMWWVRKTPELKLLK